MYGSQDYLDTLEIGTILLSFNLALLSLISLDIMGAKIIIDQ